MSAMTRRLGASMVVGLLALAGAAACGGSETPTATRTTTVSPSTTENPSPTPSPTPESGLTGPTVVAARQLSDDSRVLVAYDLDDGTTRQLATLQREDHPTVDATGTSVVVEQYTGTPDPALQSWRETGTGSHLVLIDLTTGARQELTTEHSGVFDRQPVWNRTGDGWVYFLRVGPAVTTMASWAGADLWRVSPVTGDLQKVPHGAVQQAPADTGIRQFVLEPGGRTAWVQTDLFIETGGQNQAVGRLDLATGRVTRHPYDPGPDLGQGVSLAWSPDGAWFALTDNAGGVPPSAGLAIQRWPDGEARGLMSRQPDTEGATWTWEEFGQVGWHPDDSAVVLRVTRLSWDTAVEVPVGTPVGGTPVGSRILLVDITDGSSTPIGPASVDDQSFDVWAPPATS
jgi:hypothetical protein